MYVLYLLCYYYDGMYKNKIVLQYILYLNDFKAPCLHRAREWKSPADVVFVTIQHVHLYRNILHGVFAYFCIVNTMKKVYYYCYYRRAIHIVRLRKQKQKISTSFPVARTITKNRNNAACWPRTWHLHLSVYLCICVRASPRQTTTIQSSCRGDALRTHADSCRHVMVNRLLLLNIALFCFSLLKFPANQSHREKKGGKIGKGVHIFRHN